MTDEKEPSGMQPKEERVIPPRQAGGPFVIVLDEGHEYEIECGVKERQRIKFQKGPTKECGVNGVQCDEVLRILIDRIVFLNDIQENGKYRNRYNSITITKLEEALWAMEERTKKRLARKIEGTSLP